MSRFRRGAHGAALRSLGLTCAIVLLVLLSLTAAPAHGAGWELRQLQVYPANAPGDPTIHANLTGISCPTDSLCVAVGESGAVASSTDPTGGAGAWQIVRPYDLDAEGDYACKSLGPSGEIITEPCPVGTLHRSVRAVSCPSPSLCVAVTFDGYVYSSTNPSGPESSWRIADVDGTEQDTHLESISCPDTGFCVAVSGDRNTAGKVVTSTDPTGPSGAWHVAQLDESLDLRGVSCTSRDFCLAVAGKGRILASTNPGGGPAAWNEIGAPGGSGDLDGVSCVDAGSFICLAGNAGGNLLTTTVPSAAASSWRAANGGSSTQITAASCPSPSQCVAVDNNGNVHVSGEPSGPTGSWSSTSLIPYEVTDDKHQPLNALFGASCPTGAFCALTGANGRIFTSTDPFAAAPSTPSPGQAGNARRLRKRPKTALMKTDRFREYTRKRQLKVGFRFFARSQVRGFVCKQDRGRYRRCHSPLHYWVPLGPHVLRVRAIGPTGLRGPVAAVHFSALRNPNFD